MNKKPPDLPNIEDATLRACLAPLLGAMTAGAGLSDPRRFFVPPPRPVQGSVARRDVATRMMRERSSPAPSPETPVLPPPDLGAPSGSPFGLSAGPSERTRSGSNDNPLPGPHPAPVPRETANPPETLADWRALADEDLGLFRTIELFLGMTDAELCTAATDFPRQIGGTLARIEQMKRRLAAQYDTVTTAIALLERALTAAAASEAEPN